MTVINKLKPNSLSPDINDGDIITHVGQVYMIHQSNTDHINMQYKLYNINGGFWSHDHFYDYASMVSTLAKGKLFDYYPKSSIDIIIKNKL